MKKQLPNPMLVLGALLGMTLLTGCASMNQGAYVEPSADSALAYTTVTDPATLVKWGDDRFFLGNLRSIDTYYFQVPATLPAPGETVTPSPAGTATGAPGAYQSQTGAYRVIQYRPGAATMGSSD
jgi:hypothetical protein